ncbi:MAG: hypothetical protein LLG15_11245 [Betaproteobacteria bacterium]|nr:hypothetical protein [Betaproteobacteria bacterium]
MSELSDRMGLIKDTLAAKYPARVVSRSLMDFPMRHKSELDAGVYTIVSAGEGGYANYNGREAMDGRHHILLVGQFVLGEKATPSEIEDAEGAMVDEIKAFVRSLPMALCSLVMKGYRNSQQIEHPYGWIAVDMEITQ